MEKDIFTIKESTLSYGRGYVYSLQYHLVWCTKYRKQVLKNGLDAECKKMLYELAEEYRFQILAMEVMPDHIHLLLDCKPQFCLLYTSVLKEAVAGKRVIMIDDSIVRGTTSHLIVKMLRDAGAKEVHVKVSAPPFLHPCYFGTDIPSEDQLIASGRTIEEIRQIIGADSLSYLKMERLSELSEGLPICTACFSGDYPLDPPQEDIRGEYTK